MGTLQRLPRVVGSQSFVRDICLTARRVGAEEAKSEGLVSGQVHEDKEALIKAALEMAANIARKSPVAVQGTKYYLVRASHGKDVQEELENMVN